MNNKLLIVIIISSLSVFSAITFSFLLELEYSINENEEFKILFGGDFSFGENYQNRLKEKGGINILEEKGYDYSLNNFEDLLLASDYVVLNQNNPKFNKSSLTKFSLSRSMLVVNSNSS